MTMTMSRNVRLLSYPRSESSEPSARNENQNLQYNSVPDVTVLDRDNDDFYTIDLHSAHLLLISKLWEVEDGLLCARVQDTGIGWTSAKYGFVLESLVAHGRAAPSTLANPPLVKRKVDYFAGTNQSKRARSSAASSFSQPM